MAETIETLVTEFRADIKRYEAQLQRQIRKTEAATKRNERAWMKSNRRIKADTAATMRSVGSLIAGAAVFQGLRAGTNVIADFGQAMASVKAVSGATEIQFKALEDEARRLGATTRFSATEAAEGMLFLSRAGFTTEETLKSIGPTLNLAQVGMIDLGDAADISSNILQGFRLEADEMDRVVDVMAKTVNSSNTDIRQLGDAMKLVAPVAAGMGVDIEETSAAVGALSNAGLQATLAGTGLRRVLAELESPTSASKKILAELGVTLDEVRPTTVGLTNALQRLSDAGIDTGTSLQLFGQRGGPAFEVLASSIDDIREMNAAFDTASGTAQDMARIMDDTLAGALKRSRSRLEDLILTLAEAGVEDGLINLFNALSVLMTGLADGVERLSGFLARFRSETGKASDALYAYAEATEIANQASGEAKIAAQEAVKIKRQEVIETLKAAEAKLAEAEAELARTRARRDSFKANPFSPTGQKGGLLASELGAENQARGVERLTEKIAGLRQELAAIDDGSSDLLAGIKQGFETSIPSEGVTVPIELDPDYKDQFADFLSEADAVFAAAQASAERQLAGELDLLGKLQDARDEMHGRQITLMQREYERRRQQIEAEIQDETRKAEALRLLAEERAEAERQMRDEVLGNGAASSDPVERVRAEEAAKLAALQEARELELVTLEEFEARKREIIAESEDQIQAIRGASAAVQIAAGEKLFGSLSDLAKEFAGDQSALYKALFAIEKAFAIASSLVAIQKGVAQALSLPFPANLGAAATVAAQGASVVSNLRSISGDGFADGVIGLRGPGTSRSDSIPARLSVGESVITAEGTAQNAGLLAAINAGEDVQGQIASGALGGGSSVVVGGTTLIIEGDAVQDTIPVMMAELEARDRALEAQIIDVVDRRTVFTTARHKRT